MLIKVGRWGKSLAVRIPADLASLAGLVEGETMELETRGRDILLHRPDDARRADARAAAAEILAETGHTLGGLSIRDLRDEGRR